MDSSQNACYDSDMSTEDPQHCPSFTLWVETFDDSLNTPLEETFQMAAKAVFECVSPLLSNGYTPTASLRLASNNDVQALNRDFREKNKPTNVLSFPSAPEDALIEDEPDSKPYYYLGDIIMATGVLKAEAETAEIPLTHHVAHLTIHGLLHLMGFDHETDEEAATMEALEVHILSTLNIKNPYTL